MVHKSSRWNTDLCIDENSTDKYKLDINDSVYVYFDGIKYEYKIADIYDVDKTGTVNISRDKNRTTITLITCKKYSKDKQTVFIGYLSNKESY